MANTENVLTTEQWAAARLLVARLRSEAAYEPFFLEDLGVDWLVTEDLVCATTDTGESIRLGDMLYAAIVMMWSLVVAQADETCTPPIEIVAQLGLGLASHEPT